MSKEYGQDVYVQIPADDTHTIQASPPVATSYAYYVIPQEPRRQKQCGGGCCCCALLIGMLLFFLIPRQPSVSYQYLKYVGPSDPQTGYNYTASDFVGKYEFSNNNYYSVDWSNLKMKQYWLSPNQGQANCDMYKYKYGVQYCAKRMGAFEKKSTFSTNARATSSENIPLTSTKEDLGPLAGMMAQCILSGSTLVMSSGSVGEQTGLRDFGQVHISDQYYWLLCD